MEYHRPILLFLSLEPKTKAKCAGPIESAGVFTDNQIVAAESERFANSPVHLFGVVDQHCGIRTEIIRCRVAADLLKTECGLGNRLRNRISFNPGDESLPGIRAEASVTTTGRTGAEMEALTSVAVALLTVYDMAKGVDRGMELSDISLAEKSGGVGGDYARLDGTSSAT